MTASTGEEHRGLDPAAPNRPAIPADTFAHRLMLARAHADHISIREAADLCGLGRGAWTNWERGAKTVDLLEIAQIISEKLGVDREWLLYGGPLAKPARPIPRSRRGRQEGWRDNTSGYSRTQTIRANRPPSHPNGFRRPASTRHPIAA